jgi:hypothetical protein
MNGKPITRLLSQAFTWSFLISVGCFVGIIALGAATSEHAGITPVEAILLLLMVAAGWVWYITLGIIAHRLGRRWIVWTGLPFITAPIGPLIAYLLMLGHIKADRDARVG